ncbi:uncharacterized protein LOC112888730 isoform X1 [Panicum hallii]|uniref:uncharacterized protein LOC112888730 isoform X1 n=1 Tax=Panicum hallii TaxID=206008 RepID=UPI000DF4EE2C|nr:uncharacterized protein LOC112888730 isoform X1 [Panicum hallii]XP_025810819.1 uncharacterized protein LOC112888730 isoform X1 [Panicum hallii]
MANGKQPELVIALSSTAATPEPGNDRSEDSSNHEDSTGELGMATGSTRQESIDGLSTTNLLARSPESNVAVDFELLWRLRKYLVLLGTLAVSVTYNAGLTPPGGFWTQKKDGHDAGDPILRARFFRRHEVFFYCNATAFAASLVLIILLLSKHVTRQNLWLRSMQFTMILDLFSLMGAYAAGSCRAVKSSIYIWVLVLAVFVYIVIHILLFIRVVPKWLKNRVRSALCQILCKWGVHEDQRSIPQIEDVEEGRKFMLMLVTFSATITYQAGLSPPGGFWAENEENQHPATSMLRSKNLARYNLFVSCNSTSFVASLVTIILLLSPELSRHGIRSRAVKVCVVADLLGLMGAYAAGSCRTLVQSFCVIFIAILVWIFIAVLAGSFVIKPVADCLRNVKVSCMDRVGRVFSLEYGRNRSTNKVEENSVSSNQQTTVRVTDSAEQVSALEPEHQSAYYQQVPKVKKGEPAREHQSTGEQEQTSTTEEVVSDTGHTLANDQQSENEEDVMYNQEGQSADHQSVAKVASSKTENLQFADMKKQFSFVDDPKTPNFAMSNPDHKSLDTQKIANMMGQSSSTDVQEPTIMPVEEFSKHITMSSDHNGATNNLTVEKESSDVPLKTNEIEIVRMNDDIRPNENGYTDNYEGAPRQADSKENASGNLADKHLKKSRTYLLLLAILAVSLTYQSGLNPPGGFWSKQENNNLTGGFIAKDTHHRPYHLPGDPILEDNNHRRYIVFFYLNAIAFVASIVMIIMLLNRRMSDKVIKRYALQTAMIVDLLSLTGSYLSGSCRKTKNSMYILLLLCLVFAYVLIHVLIAIHAIPEGWKQLVSEKLEHLSCKHLWPRIEPGHNQGGEGNEKNWERRRKLLLMLAVLSATVTYQAGMSPPGGVWSDDKGVSGKPGYPILQDNNLKRYDVFYYSNSVSFVSSVAITILLVNRESCEHGIKFYALRVCSVVGLVGLLIAYAAGSCRKAKQSIYLIIIAVAVLISVVIQVFLLSSTHSTLGGPFGRCMKCLLEWLFGATEAVQESTSNKQESSGHRAKKARKRHKYLVLLAIVAASITYQAGLSPPGGFWSNYDGVHTTSNPVLNPPADYWWYNKSHMAGNPVLLDIHPRRYKTFFWLNSLSFMASIVVIMYLLNTSIWKMDVPLEVLHLIMILDLLALVTAFAAGSCRKFRTSIYVYGLVLAVVIYLVIVVLLSKSIADFLKPGETSGRSSQRHTNGASGTEPLISEQEV